MRRDGSKRLSDNSWRSEHFVSNFLTLKPSDRVSKLVNVFYVIFQGDLRKYRFHSIVQRKNILRRINYFVQKYLWSAYHV